MMHILLCKYLLKICKNRQYLVWLGPNKYFLSPARSGPVQTISWKKALVHQVQNTILKAFIWPSQTKFKVTSYSWLLTEYLLRTKSTTVDSDICLTTILGKLMGNFWRTNYLLSNIITYYRHLHCIYYILF